jgi:hypothetical protein
MTIMTIELIPLYKVRKMLNVSWPRMMQIVRDGELRVYNVSRQKMHLEDIGEDGSGLRVRGDDLDAYIDSIMIGANDDVDLPRFGRHVPVTRRPVLPV